MDEADADGEWSDDDILQSGSQTGISETEPEDYRGRRGQLNRQHQPYNNQKKSTSTPVDRSLPTRQVNNTGATSGARMTGGADPVDEILDKIDAELDAMDQTSTKVSWKPDLTARAGTPQPRTSPGLFSKQYTPNPDSDVTKAKNTFGPETMFNTSSRTNGFPEVHSVPDIPAELDAVTAHQTDLQFKEIMRKKKEDKGLTFQDRQALARPRPPRAVSPRKVRIQESRDTSRTPPINAELSQNSGKSLGSLSTRLKSRSTSRPSAMMLSTGYGTDNESIQTEEFESRFMGMVISPSDTEKGETMVKPLDSRPQATPRRTIPSIQMTPDPQGLSVQDENLLQHLVKKSEESRTLQGSRSPTLLTRPRSLSPTRMRYGENPSDRLEHGADRPRSRPDRPLTLRERDSERDRRVRSASPPVHRDGPSMMWSAGVPDQSAELAELTTMRQALMKTRRDLTETERALIDTREMTEDAKSKLMVLEFNKGSALKEVDRLNDDIKRRQVQLTALDSELQNKLQELKNMASYGVTREDCMEVKNVKDENEALKVKLRNMEGLGLERDELVRQLDAAKEDLLREQKHIRLQEAELREEIENLTSKLEEVQNGWSKDQDQLGKLQQAYKRMEREKNELIQGKAREYEALKASYKEEVGESQMRMKKEVRDMETELKELRQRVTEMHADNISKESTIQNLNHQLQELHDQLTKELQERQKNSSEHKTSLQNLKKETAAAVMSLKETLFLEKQKAIEDLKNDMDYERRESAARNEERLSQILNQHSCEIAEKNEEIMRLEDLLQRLENQMQGEIDMQVREAVHNERALAEQENDRRARLEQEERTHRECELTTQIQREKQLNQALQGEITNYKKELEEQRRQQREANKEKLLAVSRTKEQMKQQSSAEIERIKFNLSQDHEETTNHLREQLRYQEAELISLNTEKEAAVERERKLLQTLEHIERTTTQGINEECQKLSSLLGISPDLLQNTSHHADAGDNLTSSTNRSVPAINTAIANLRSCNNELHGYVFELRQELDALKDMVERTVQEKDEAVENYRLEMEKQKTLDLEKIKEKLLQEHVQEMNKVIRDCAEANSQLKTNRDYLQRYGDAALLEALQAKDDELHILQQSMTQWRAEIEEKLHTKLQLQMAKEREKYQALQHHATREQKRISDLQKREIERLEKEVQHLAMTPNNASLPPRPPPHTAQISISATASVPSSPTPSSNLKSSQQYLQTPTSNLKSYTHCSQTSNLKTSSQYPQTSNLKSSTQYPQTSNLKSSSQYPQTSNLKSSQQYLQNRIQQLQEENSSLRKQRLLASSHLNLSTPNLASTKSISTPDRSRSPTRDPKVMLRLGERIRQGEKDALKAEESAKLNQKILNNKMKEMAKLQNTLINQNQELQELERAYNDLHKHYNSRPCSPTRNINSRSSSPTRNLNSRPSSPARNLSSTA